MSDATRATVIAKQARDTGQQRRRMIGFPSARSAFRALLHAVDPRSEGRVLLPAYVGWSAREGSGVFDPVREHGSPYAFYRVDRRLRIDLEHLERVLKSQPVKVFVIIHYFGYVDPAYPQAVAMAREHGAMVLEDEAHAMFSDLIGGRCGRLGDACIYSLHKMLPVPAGGLLAVNPGCVIKMEDFPAAEVSADLPWDYDLGEMARRRRENALLLHQLSPRLKELAEPLWPEPTDGEIPQTLPMLLLQGSRDELYFALNEAGFGIVSLYHTMIEEIGPDAFPDSHHLSRRIFNLPVHQDAAPWQLEAMIEHLERHLRAGSRP